MNDLTFWLGVLLLSIYLYNWKHGALGANYIIKVTDDRVLLKSRLGKYVYKKPAYTIEMKKVAKLQRADSVISFFYHSGHAIDIWYSGNKIDSFWQELLTIFPEAEIVIIK